MLLIASCRKSMFLDIVLDSVSRNSIDYLIRMPS
jgi:hypothetical protein